MAIVVWLVLAGGASTCARCGSCAAAASRVPRAADRALARGDGAVDRSACSARSTRSATTRCAPTWLQHLLIADLAAPLMLVGPAQPGAGLLPAARRARAAGAHAAAARRRSASLRKPLVALPVYALVLYGWHFSVFFEAAVRHPLVHALQHASFIAIGVLVWWSVLEPKRRRLRGELWKIGHILAARFLGMFLGMSFVLIRAADLHGRLRERRARARAQPARRPAARRRR